MLLAKKSLRGRVLGLLVFLQSALIVTGGSVRLTGSGLGCPTWPECTPGSYVPVANQAEGQLHAWIEFGNRLLTFVLLICALAVVTFSVRVSKNAANKERVRSLAALQILGIFGQGMLGGVTVLTDLHPLTVAAHYLLSILLIAGAISLRYELIGTPVEKTTGLISFLMPIFVWLTFLVLVAGTIVTGSGPHAGDEKAERFGFDPQVVSWIHADLVIALIVLAVMLLLIAHQSGMSLLVRRIGIFLLIAFSQGVIGYIQYFTGLPEALVAAHLIGSTLVWGSVWSIAKISNSGFRVQGLRR
ncbi:MAG: oxidase assembly protein [Actinobacteria bacterium BACL4 MAG-120920-bin74]|jgi:heme a synthase|nr:MAG: oxidase assembly protein [Actinobacteria bacterium BACL4 MAG-120920-bin74]